MVWSDFNSGKTIKTSILVLITLAHFWCFFGLTGESLPKPIFSVFAACRVHLVKLWAVTVVGVWVIGTRNTSNGSSAVFMMLTGIPGVDPYTFPVLWFMFDNNTLKIKYLLQNSISNKYDVSMITADQFYHTSIVGILDCSWSLWYYVCWIFPSLAHITYCVPKWRCNITEISRLHQLCHDNVQISWYHITTSHFESFFGARLIKTPGQRKSTAESHRRHKPAFDSDLIHSRLQCD